jgi:hypothetical protein
MSEEIERLARKFASTRSFDGYAVWRMLKDIDNEIFELARTKSPVPIELARLRSVIVKTRELRKRKHVATPHSGWGARDTRADTLVLDDGFDAFDFVDHYRALGGRRVAWRLGTGIELGPSDQDTREAAAFWMNTWPTASQARRRAISRALLIRGHY